ncbi:MAG: hypothetical protein GY903_15115 [Fuerstiella sp.]|nr:hypothetical protein [Fuerstiella sp.]MCP4855813.1 hypothetical protein [Fuerstiella sp.]
MKPRHPVIILIGTFLCVDLSQTALSQTVTVNTRDQIVRATDNAAPGTTILIAPGTYQGSLSFNGLRGEQNKPIVLAAADKENPPVFKGRNSCIHLTDPAFVELHNLVLTEARGNGINIDDGGSYDSPAHHVVLRGLTVRDVGPDGNRDGIKLSGLDNFRVENCTIERWGSGGSGIDMVGCHDGQVTGCTFRHSGKIAGNGVQAKGGSRDIVIQRCRFEYAGGRGVNIGGSTGLPYFRPQVGGYEARDITVQDCTFIGSSAPICFVGVDGAIVKYNTIHRPQHYVVRILQESRGSQFVPCRNGSFSNNLIAFQSDEIRGATNVGPGTAAETFTFANNHWYCIDRPERSHRLSLPVKETGGSYGTDPQFANPPRGDLHVLDTSPVRDAGVRTQSVDSQ